MSLELFISVLAKFVFVMEALGAAASAIGVVSLAVQLVETVQDIISFLKSLEGAPEQIERLIYGLDQLNDVLKDVRSVAEVQQFGSDIPVSSMEAALKGCLKEISFVEAVLKKLQIGYGSSRGFVRKKWNSLKFLNKRKEIEDFEGKIQQSMNHLTLSLLASMTKIS